MSNFISGSFDATFPGYAPSSARAREIWAGRAARDNNGLAAKLGLGLEEFQQYLVEKAQQALSNSSPARTPPDSKRSSAAAPPSNRSSAAGSPTKTPPSNQGSRRSSSAAPAEETPGSGRITFAPAEELEC